MEKQIFGELEEMVHDEIVRAMGLEGHNPSIHFHEYENFWDKKLSKKGRGYQAGFEIIY